jgi:hypothetical protein
MSSPLINSGLEDIDDTQFRPSSSIRSRILKALRHLINPNPVSKVQRIRRSR